MPMEEGGGDKVPDDDDGGGEEDRLSALPDDVLAHILLRLRADAAGRTSVLSRRWRRVWTLLPELGFFTTARDLRKLLDSLGASDVPLRRLSVLAPFPSAQPLAAWLHGAACRVSGELRLVNLLDAGRIANGEEEEEEDSFELPSFEKATSMLLDLGFLGLTELTLAHARFHSPGDLGGVVSSPRCPCLQKLTVRNFRGLDSITIFSTSLQLLHLQNIRGVRQVTVATPSLENLTFLQCLFRDGNRPVATISAPQLKSLEWGGAYDPSSVLLGSMEHLQTLGTFFFVYGPDGFTHNSACLMLLPQFKAMDHLILLLEYLPNLDNRQYLMEDMTMLPGVTNLQLTVLTEGHAIGACSFHVLRISSGIKRLVVVLSY